MNGTLLDHVTVLPEPMTCASRQDGKQMEDRWYLHKNGDRVCSYCGSLPVDEFWKLVEAAEEPDSDIRIEPSDKPYKVYIYRDSVKNAFDGAIKFYTWHCNAQEISPARFDLYVRVLQLSAQRLQRRMKMMLHNGLIQ